MADSDPSTQIVSRIFINSEGDLVVTDMWDDLFEAFFQEQGGEIVFRD